MVRANRAESRTTHLLKRTRMKSEIGTKELIDRSLIDRLRQQGALVLDVDDTLLSRDSIGAKQESFVERPAARLSELLRCGFTVCIMTGHGWRQLESRLMNPVIEQVKKDGNEDYIGRLYMYANRGATKIIWDGKRHKLDEVYGYQYQLCEDDVPTLRRLLESLAMDLCIDVRARNKWYRENFGKFDFDAAPASIEEREGAIMVLRPIPGPLHVTDLGSGLDMRAELLARGREMLQQAKLGCRYELACSGRSSIEISRRGVSKELAVHDLLRGLAESTGKALHDIESSLIYLGDEFFPEGNDFVIALRFPAALCLSVINDGNGQLPPNVVQLPRFLHKKGIEAADEVLRHFICLAR